MDNQRLIRQPRARKCPLCAAAPKPPTERHARGEQYFTHIRIHLEEKHDGEVRGGGG